MAVTEGPHAGMNAASEAGLQAGGVMSALAPPARDPGPLTRGPAGATQAARSAADTPSARAMASARWPQRISDLLIDVVANGCSSARAAPDSCPYSGGRGASSATPHGRPR